jgi:hypothetical protein
MLFAQPAFSLSYNGYFDDNIFNNYENIEDYINSFSLSSAYNFESEVNNIQVYYEGNLSSYRQYTFKTSDSHRIGIVETHLFSENDNPLNAGLNFSLRNNRDEFKIFDFNQLSAYVNYRQFIPDDNYLTLGYLFRRNNYKNLSLFSHYEHIAFLRWTSEFNTGTVVNAGAEINNKRYFDSYIDPEYADDALQLKFNSKIYQVLSERSGLALNFEYRKNLTEESRYLIDSDYIYYEEEIFNDIYSNDGLSAGIQFTQMIIEEIIFGAEVKYLSRNFTSLPAADMQGNSQEFLREDDQLMTGALLNFDFAFLLEGMALELRWNYIRNKSNDYYYDYNNNLISFSINYFY